MKKMFTLLLIILFALSLGGCGIFAKAREVEHMLVIQTLGLDRSKSGVRLSLASGAPWWGAAGLACASCETSCFIP